MADFYTFLTFIENQDGTTKRDMVINLDNVLTVVKVENPYDKDSMEVLLVDGTTFKAYYYDEFEKYMGRKDG
jgi:hypothetical protein